ncbi:MAG: DNA-directed RNA polymerase subunit D [Candidatus Anstonellaceae archaeon]
MKLSITDKEDNRLYFVVSGVYPQLANTLRRYAMSELEVFAFDSITIYENSSILFDEYLAHRIGLIPLTFKGTPKKDDEFIFTLEVEGPAKVLSSHLKPSDSNIKVVFDNIPLVVLKENQSIRLEAKAVLGIGRKHAKWQAGLCSYEISSEKNDEFKFFLESFGQMEPIKMLEKTFNTITNHCNEFLDALDNLKTKEE